jgi:hypothetical protein
MAPKKWMEFTEEAQRITDKWRRAMGEDIPPGEPAKTDPPSGEPAKTDPPSGEPAKTDPPSGEPAKTDPPSGEPAKDPPPAKKRKRRESKYDEAKLLQLDALYPDATAKELLRLYEQEKPGDKPPSVRWVQRHLPKRQRRKNNQRD